MLQLQVVGNPNTELCKENPCNNGQNELAEPDQRVFGIAFVGRYGFGIGHDWFPPGFEYIFV